MPGIAGDHGPTVQLVDLVREEWNDPLTIIIVRSILTRNGTAPDRVPNLGYIICQYFWGVRDFSIWKHFDHDISVHKQPIHLFSQNKCLYRQAKCHASWCYTNSLWCYSEVTKQSDRWNLTLVGVIPTLFKYVYIKLNMKIMCWCWLTVVSWIMFVFFLNKTFLDSSTFAVKR